MTWAQLSLILTLTVSLQQQDHWGIFIFEEAYMFEVTALAVNNLKAYLEQNKISSAIRIALMQGG